MPNLLSKPDSFAGVYVWVMFGNLYRLGQHHLPLAALSAIDPTYYEAATMDGASRMQRFSTSIYHYFYLQQ